MRAAQATVCSVLLASAAFGCTAGDTGGARDAPTVRAFCDAVGQFRDDVEAADPSDIPAYVEALKAAARRLDGVGTPDGIPDSARAGFELTVRRIEALPDDATEEDLSALGDVDEEGETTLDDLEAYVEQTCPDLTPTASPSPSAS
jgi:hypothetical protein